VFSPRAVLAALFLPSLLVFKKHRKQGARFRSPPIQAGIQKNALQLDTQIAAIVISVTDASGMDALARPDN